MLEMLRGDLSEFMRKLWKPSLSSYHKINLELHLCGESNKILVGDAYIDVNAPTDEFLIQIETMDTKLPKTINFFVYNEREYDHSSNVLGFSSDSFNGRYGILPYNSFRDKIDIREPVFSLYQSIHSSEFDYELFRNKLEKNKFNYTVGQNAFCTDVHFYDAKDYNRFKLIMNNYSPPMYWFNPYVNPGYFKNLFGE